MSIKRIILDTGPLVAFLDKREACHSWVVRMFKDLHPPFLICEPILTEVCFLLQHQSEGIEHVQRWLDIGYLQIAFQIKGQSERIFTLLQKYRDLPMSVADASLVMMIENGIGDRVLTLDSHFRIYRHSGRRIVPLLMPENRD